MFDLFAPTHLVLISFIGALLIIPFAYGSSLAIAHDNLGYFITGCHQACFAARVLNP